MRFTRSIGFAMAVAVGLMADNSSRVSGQSRGSSIVRECTTGADCIPNVASVLIVWVVDAVDAGIANVPVEIVRADAAAGSTSALATWRTDRNGVTGGSMTAGERYRIRINESGFFPFASEVRVAEGGKTHVVTVQLRVPPILCGCSTGHATDRLGQRLDEWAELLIPIQSKRLHSLMQVGPLDPQ
jgi:hypothetical protein